MIEQEFADGESAPLRPTVQHRPMNSLLAAATRLTARTIKKSGRKGAGTQGWQEDAWDMYDLVGEQRFLASTLGGRCSQARFFVGTLPEDPTEPPEPINDDEGTGSLSSTDQLALDTFDSLASNPAQFAQIVARLAVNLFIAGDGWLVGIPPDALPSTDEDPNRPGGSGRGDSGANRRASQPSPDRAISPLAPVPVDPDGEESPELLALSDLEWRMLSVSEVSFDQDKATLHLGDASEEKVEVDPDQVFLIRVWRPHPRRWWQADSPTRASLPVLRELVGLTMHVSAQVDSRLAGAGIFLVPKSAKEAILAELGDPSEDEEQDPFTEALMDAMITPINDRSNASALVPLVLTVPDDSVEKFKHLSFASELDTEARDLRDEAIRRLALGQDAPPEILLGVGGMNHWGAWLVREDTINTHVEPPLALVCDALTTQFLQSVLIENDVAEEIAERYVIWYDVDHLIQRPNRAADAKEAHAAGAISDPAYRDALGFSEADAPPATQQLDPAVAVALDMVAKAPSLAQNPGLPALVEQLRGVMAGTAPGSGDGQPAPEAEAEAEAEVEAAPEDETGETEGSPPTETEDEAAGPDEAAPPSIAASGRHGYGSSVFQTIPLPDPPGDDDPDQDQDPQLPAGEDDHGLVTAAPAPSSQE